MSAYEKDPQGGELHHPSVAFDAWVEGAIATDTSAELPDIQGHAFDTSTDYGIEMRFPYGQTVDGDEVIDARDIYAGNDEQNKILHEHLVVRGTAQLGITLNTLTGEPEPVATFVTTRQMPASRTSDDVFIWSTEKVIQVPLYTGDKDDTQRQQLLRTIQHQGLRRLVVDMQVVPGYAIGQAEDVQYGKISTIYASEQLHQLDDPMPQYGKSVVIEGSVTDPQLEERGEESATISLTVQGQSVQIECPRTYSKLDKQVNLDSPQTGVEPATIRAGDTVQVSVYPTEDGTGFSTQPQRALYHNYSPDITRGDVPAFYLVQGGDERLEASLEEVTTFNNHLKALAEAADVNQFRQAVGQLLDAHFNPNSTTRSEQPFLLSDQQLEAIYEVVRKSPHAVQSGPHAPLIPITAPNHQIPGRIEDHVRIQWAFGDALQAGFGSTTFSVSRAEFAALCEEYASGSVLPEYSHVAGSSLFRVLKAVQANVYDQVLQRSLTPDNLNTLCGQPNAASEDLATTLQTVLVNGQEWAADDPARADQLLQAYSHLLDSAQTSIVDRQLDEMLGGIRSLVSRAGEFNRPLTLDTTNHAANQLVALKNPALAVVVTHAAPILDKLDTWIRETPRDTDEMFDDPRFTAIRNSIKTSAHYLEEVATLRHYLKRLAAYQPQEKWRTSDE